MKKNVLMCSVCQGTGQSLNRNCWACDGAGQVETETEDNSPSLLLLAWLVILFMVALTVWLTR